jgi:hypothetical protein
MLELTDSARERIKDLQTLAGKAEDGDAEARNELRAALRESTPEIIARCSNTARVYRGVLAKTASGGDPLVEEAIKERAARMASEVAGENPTPLEALLADRIASCGCSWSFRRLSTPPGIAKVRSATGLARTTYSRRSRCRRAPTAATLRP